MKTTIKRKLLLLTAAVAATAASAWAFTVYCPVHSYASCYNTGQIAPTGSGAHKYHCTCGDDVWVKD